MRINYIEILKKYGFKVINFIDSKNIESEDADGYKYKLNYSSILNGKKPNRFMRNPYAIHNIKKYLSITHPTYELLDNEYINCNTKMRFICKNHREKGIQYNTVTNIIHSHHTCKYCGYKKMSDERRIPDSSIMNRCKEINVVYVSRFVKKNETWVSYICLKHREKGTQNISWYHLKTCVVGCPYCIGRHRTTDEFKSELSKINDGIEVIGEYLGSEKPVKSRCKICNHIWTPIGRSLLYNTGCPSCKITKGEDKIKKYLLQMGIKFAREKTFDGCVFNKKLKFDFYIKDLSLCIEYDGEQHFMPVDFASKGALWANEQYILNKKRDEIKNNYCKINNIKLLRIPYTDFNNIDNILDSEIQSLLLCENS